ncbi:hypothetical protein COW36_17805 [bacterium (Candidatus Blackallbacteria) CG17_big_fil_post_rev_8_21_14_2_50_48_46]|uniref:Uncharacterized protein n=1 Tax=bacterium (Candidatus Blackallbacteria) CG17_big_fil_post_rev_8_21_14_2_50_48_46 TaxID=2014261 RepID=A0A2M7G0R6_9BACT|nr:MAG: hypothetical protein COW64_00920 [bacterium (Candidatus Blackallbacteria) CG18_big_fil_WC_8_21_14_2_50_49_26]PIW15272.1 MAG: hypothetical protein COW36_17805 [bacterium (Candidatus Blackallbacteria) CG17_big_fil_post_rev_8_21_14_2_50_48_46]PIW45219.1 MAG: hypothetical protein COW20_21210 [bacterium (Candidatus Blackallbacteria) CG13_big_fil_rev_8_21_14_2_50_49_14]
MSSAEKKPFSIEEETPLAYFEKLVEFIYDPWYARFLRRISARYERAKIPEEIELMPFFVDSLIFETFIDRKTPLDRFIEHYQAQLKPRQLKIYQRFKTSALGCYEILERHKPDRLLLRDLLDDSPVEVHDGEAWRYMMPGFYAICRLLPYEDSLVLTGSCAVLNYKTREEVLALAREFKHPPLFVEGESRPASP